MLARSRLTSLGFNVAPDARHPFGTGNALVFFADRSFLEPITIVDRGAADMAAAEGFFFVRRIKRYTERQGEG
ncbi:MAG TPA: VOC family protein, partial [Propylenella sp.]|nr:VOC family protein [Propylenella sp.]